MTGNLEDADTHQVVIPPTKMIYMTYEGNWQMECEAQVLSSCKDDDNGKAVQVCLDQTVMHAQGGGQPTDVGTLRSSVGHHMDVTKVMIDRETGVATHFGALKAGCGELVPGETVKVSVDKDTRRLLSECHTAGHVVDSAMARCGKAFKPSKAYHFLDGPYVEYEGQIPPEERDSVLEDLQKAFLDLVNEDIKTKIELMSMAEADALCNRIAKNFDMDVFADKQTKQVRVVTVAGYPCPCGGTHVRSTNDLQQRQWGITGIKAKKNVVRVKYGQGTSNDR